VGMAEDYLTRAIKKGAIYAEFDLGFLFEKEGNVEKAMKWYTIAANHDNKEAKTRVTRLEKLGKYQGKYSKFMGE